MLKGIKTGVIKKQTLIDSDYSDPTDCALFKTIKEQFKEMDLKGVGPNFVYLNNGHQYVIINDLKEEIIERCYFIGKPGTSIPKDISIVIDHDNKEIRKSK